jgi:ATP-dependent DNA ligase
VSTSERTVDVLAGLRPQLYGYGRTDRVKDPLVEPQWTGVRVLGAVEDDVVELRDAEGDIVTDRPEVQRALVDAVRAGSLIFDGFLTKDAVRDNIELLPATEMPTAGQLLAKPFLGMRRDRIKEVREQRERLARAATFRDDEVVVLMITDLLRLDGQSLLDVPLLERKRLLDAVVAESELVRVGVFVRPPIDMWVTSWRRLGFFGLSFRGANSRYHPGEERDEWTTAPMPRR